MEEGISIVEVVVGAEHSVVDYPFVDPEDSGAPNEDINYERTLYPYLISETSYVNYLLLQSWCFTKTFVNSINYFNTYMDAITYIG